MKIVSKIKTYELQVVANAITALTGYQKNKAGRMFYFIDQRIASLYHDELKDILVNSIVLNIEASEKNKEYLKLADYYRFLIEKGFTRQDMLVTIGGGILQDISGFIASTLYRGIKWVLVPTTLLAQADSCIGSKTSINFGDAKNLVGTFYPPDEILVDIRFTQSLSDADFNSGLGEIIKFHLLSDENHYTLLKRFLASGDLRHSLLFQETIFSTLDIKRSYFESDEFDTGRRNLLNYGHCFGHALESATGFGIAHGEAVLVGMGFANEISLKRGLMTKDVYEEWGNILNTYYPVMNWSKVSIEDLIAYMKKDKKRAGKDLTMILAHRLGDAAKYDDLTEDEITEAYRVFVKKYPDGVKV